jgi:hypothetical protein
MNKELGVWTHEGCALVLADYQNEVFEVIGSETDAALVELHARRFPRSSPSWTASSQSTARR